MRRMDITELRGEVITNLERTDIYGVEYLVIETSGGTIYAPLHHIFDTEGNRPNMDHLEWKKET